MEERKLTRKIYSIIKSSKKGITLSEIISKAEISRTTALIYVSYLLGTGEIWYKRVGVTKLYFTSNEKENKVSKKAL